MTKLTREDLWSLESYAEKRAGFRTEVMQHKKDRQLMLGEHLRLLFEDETTVRYQIQEMLRIEKIFEAAGIQDELDAYNPLIPDGQNWKCTMMIEYSDVDERRAALSRLLGVESRVWAQVADYPVIQPIANEDLERSNDEKTSSVHFLRFELTPDMVQAVKSGAAILFGVDHPDYKIAPTAVSASLQQQLADDLTMTH